MSSSAPPKTSGWSGPLACVALWLSVAACDATPSAPSANTASGSLDGELSAVSVLGSTGGASTLYFLRIAGRGTPVPLTFDADPDLPSNTSVRLWGASDGSAFHVSRLVVMDDPSAGSDAVTRSALIGQPSTSPTVAWVQMDVNSGGVTQTVAQAQQLIFGNGTGPLFGTKAGQMSLVQYYAENSYGMMQLTGQVEGPIPFSGTACNNFDPLAQNVVAQVTAMGRTYDHYYLYWGSEQPCGPGWGDQGTRAKPGKYVWLNNDGTFCTATGQELGHNFGMMHASTMDCPNATIANDTTTCTSNEYGNPMTVMGGGCGHLNAIEKWYDGFLLGCNAIKVGASGTFTLLPIEIPCNGIQALQIAMPSTAPTRTTTTDQSDGPVTIAYYYLELRGGTLMDTGMKTGVYVHAAADIPVPKNNGVRTFLLDMNPATTAFDPMSSGQTFTDPAGGVSFTLNSVSASQASVTVTIASGNGATGNNVCQDGTTLVGSGPSTCGMSAAGGAGAGGAGGGTGGATGSGGAGGKVGGTGGAGKGGAGGSGGGSSSTGTGGSGVAGATGTGAGGAITTGAGGTVATGAGGNGASGAAGAGGATGGTGATGEGGTTSTTGAGGVSGMGAGGVGNTGTAGSGSPTGTGEASVSSGCSCEIESPTGHSPLASFAFIAGVTGVVLVRRRKRMSSR